MGCCVVVLQPKAVPKDPSHVWEAMFLQDAAVHEWFPGCSYHGCSQHVVTAAFVFRLYYQEYSGFHT